MDRKLLLNGSFSAGQAFADVKSPWNGRVIGRVAQASPAQVEQALAAAAAARPRLQAQSTGARRDLLTAIAAGLRARQTEIAEVICDEAGKPISLARLEVSRAIDTFTLAAAELSHFGGEIVPVDFASNQGGTECEIRRFPAGVVVGIVPFNFPLNLGAHKVAPALAVGAPIIVKPPPQAPSAQLILAELALGAGADPAALQVLPCDTPLAERLATDPRVRVLSFTGSAKVGWHLKSKVAAKAVLELGGNAAAIVADDADLDRATQRLAASAFGYAGQTCIKVQRIIVDARVWERFIPLFIQHSRALQVGDPREEKVLVGPVIDDRSADRIVAWVEEAVSAGAQVLLGGEREGRLLRPTVLAQVPRASRVFREEVFGPVVLLSKSPDFESAIAEANDSDYGLQASVFTRDLRRVRLAFHRLEVGGVVVDDAPSFRSDAQPYGGSKGSGLGREGPRWAMEDFTESRALLLRP
jgi:acyl-CoA reductase-like NAD-dependent aldehyde dehydrogenase